MRSKIEQQVMGRVAAMYVARQFVSAPALKLYVAVAAFLGLAKLVWVARIFENLEQVGVGGAVHFLVSAVLNTDFWVQLVFAVLIIAALSLMRDLLRPTKRLMVA